MDVKVRRAEAGDLPLLEDMLVEAANWHPDWKLPRDEILRGSDFTHYLAGWPRPTDRGVVAEVDGVPAGAAWYRLLTADDPGYGYVDDETPELSIGVVATYRGRGIGRLLLRELANAARAAGYRQLSLSVARRNHAKALYESEGYRTVESGRDSDTMLKEL
jgi:GNAT superfamily N-acetyltransferase